MRISGKKAGAIVGLLAAVCASVALISSSASAEVASPATAEFCANSTVNNVQKCFGSARQMNRVTAIGSQTGVCAGYDTTQGNCSPVGYPAVAYAPLGTHSPWVIGTAAASTYFQAVAGVVE